MEPSKRYIEAIAQVKRLEERDREIAEKIVAQRAIAAQIRTANAQSIVDGGIVDSGKLLEANSHLDELESALALIREKNLPAAREEMNAAGHEEAIREVREINQLNESEYNVLIRDTFSYIDRLRVINRRQQRKLDLQTTYRGLGAESILGDMSAASAAGAFQSVLFVRLELLTRIKKMGLLSQTQQDEYDRLYDLFYGEVSRQNKKAAEELAAAQLAHDNGHRVEAITLREA